jgi:F0F1-type ATP synthase membrane subunit b/b'
MNGYRIISVLLLFTCITLVYAQPRMQTPKERADELKTKLTLSADQTKKAEQIYTKAESKMKSLFEESSGDREKMGKSMMAEMEKTDTEILKILNDKQKKEYKKLQEERKQMFKNMTPPDDPNK